MLDRDGYRPNVGIILINARNEVFWGKRIREHSWQFPQGGIKRGESPEQAMLRELHEEVGLLPEHVRILGRTREWLRYDVPMNWVRREWRGSYRGQKQIWFLLRLVGRDTDIDLRASGHPEFDAWRWSHFWVPLDAVIEFKRDVYRLALMELSRLLPPARALRDVERARFVTPRFLRGHRGQPKADPRTDGASAGVREARDEVEAEEVEAAAEVQVAATGAHVVAAVQVTVGTATTSPAASPAIMTARTAPKTRS